MGDRQVEALLRKVILEVPVLTKEVAFLNSQIEEAKTEFPFPDSVMATIMSFTCHGADTAELDRLKAINPNIARAIDAHFKLFQTGTVLEARVLQQGRESIILCNKEGLWYLKDHKVRREEGNSTPGVIDYRFER